MPPPRTPDPGQRIAKLLARAGVASRREVERMIAEGRVALNGVALGTPATVLPSLAGVTVDGKPVETPAEARLFLYHKPPGLLVTERDPGGRPTIYDRLPAGLPRVVPVGRLDLSTEGLLLLTTDGGLKRQLELPATGVERVYRARAYGQIGQGVLEELITGVEIDGVRYGPIDANLERRTGANVWIEMKLAEGKNREVRRVLDHLGLRVSRLIRTAYGPFALGELPPGQVAEVRPHDIASFRANPTRRDLPQPPRRTSHRPTPVAAHAAAEEAVAPPARAEPSARPARATRPAAKGHLARPGRRAAADPAPITKPVRAARARAHREATGAKEPASATAEPARGARGRTSAAARTSSSVAPSFRVDHARTPREDRPDRERRLNKPQRPTRTRSDERPSAGTGERRPGGRAGPTIGGHSRGGRPRPPVGKPPRRPGR